MRERLTSSDGTVIAFDRTGEGPTVVLVGGGLDDGGENAPLAPELAGRFTVVNYSRRGRGDSGDTAPYAVEREIEDLAALAEVAGVPVHLFGASSGGALALEAVLAGLPVDRVAVYEVPWFTDAMLVGAWQQYVEELTAAVARDDRDTQLELFMRLAGSSEEDIAGARSAPVWPWLREIAPTLAYDAACIGDGPPPTDRLAAITRPVLAATGVTVDPHMAGLPADFFGSAADAIAAAVPGAERRTIETDSHVVDPKRLAPVLTEFFGT
jgi:pimeloyl-ACP methyl ester carboxylesterase